MARAAAAILPLLLLLAVAGGALAASADMSIIAYNAEHGARGLERTEAEARAVYDLWLAENGGGSSPNANSIPERERRFRAFWDNLNFVDAHNARAAAGEEGYRLGMNRFADLTNDEFRAAYLGVKAQRARPGRMVGERYRHDGAEELPEAVDWREKGAVAPVKNQGQCGVAGLFLQSAQ
ncbi:unnamed protein product [Triticum turgidum subsp. durum]|uniref:Cathepsin propeptide inhibitor domain-containing protein n=1 Tax=Triticum turgidum subsp. durum TaxID=4567 RepID=A0A9R1P881_TRITD|nr:unnamed protein product [Triticum turgidum subsp. durum]